MTPRKTLLLAAVISMAPAGFVMAQSQTTPTDTSPSAASSPSQRDATSMPTTESPPADSPSTSPAAASSPHQQQATRTASKQAMKECVAKQQSDNSGMSAADAKKACKAQLKGSG
jgi:hypothetical protein